MKPFLVLIALFISSTGVFAAISLDDLKGTWYNEDYGTTMQIIEKDGLLYGKVLKLDDAEKQQKLENGEGDPMMARHFKYDAEDDKWIDGGIYPPFKPGKSIKATLEVENKNAFTMIGKVLVFTKKIKWKRVE